MGSSPTSPTNARECKWNIQLVYRHASYGEPEVIKGKVVENFKLPGDVCVEWETGQLASYDTEWLDQFAEITA